MMDLAAASVRRRPGGYLGTFFAALLGIALITGSGSMLFSVLTAGSGSDRFAGVDAVIAADRSVTLQSVTQKKTKTKSKALTGAPALPDDLVAEVTRVSRGATVVPDYAFRVELGPTVTGPDRIPVLAHGWSSAALTPYNLRAGHAPAAGEIVLDAGLTGASVGDTVSVLTKTGMRELRIAGIAAPRGQDALPDQEAVFVADDQVAALSGLSGPTAIAVTGGSTEALAAAVRGTDASVLTGADKVRADIPGAAPDYVGPISIMATMLGMTVFAAVFVLAGTVTLAVRGRLRELALLRTIGATPGRLRRMLAAETGIVAILAAVFGVPAGIVLANVIAWRFRDLGALPPRFRPEINPLVLIGAVVAGFLVVQVAARIAARRAVKIAPTQALLETVVEPTGGKTIRIILSLVLAAGAAALLIFIPLGGKMGMGMGFLSCALLLCSAAALGPLLVGLLSGPLSRIPGLTGVLGWLAGLTSRAGLRRVTSVAVPLALMFAVNATMLLNSDLSASVDTDAQAARTAPATLALMPKAGSGVPLDTATQIANLPGVGGAAATIPTTVIVNENGKPQHYPAQGLLVTGTDPALDLGIRQGKPTADGLAVSTDFAAAHGWRVGDRVSVWLADGTKTELPVAASYDRSRGFGDVVLPARLVAAHDPKGLVGRIYLHGSPTELGRRFPMLAVTDPHSRQVIGNQARNQQAATELMVAITLGFTAIAVINNFAIATAGRRREFADLRLAGATPRQVRRLTTWETVIAVLTGLIIGSAVTGVVVGAFSVAQDGHLRWVAEPLTGLGLVAGACLLGLVSGVIPARVIIRRRALPQLADAD